MQSLLENVNKNHFFSEPFPHIVVTDALDDTLCSRLIDEFPPINIVTESNQYPSNERFSYSAHKVLGNPQISELWREFIRVQTSDIFLKQFLDLFEQDIRRIYPSFEQEIASVKTLKSGVRNIDEFPNVDILLDAQICVNTPVVATPSVVKQAHLDRRQVLFAGLYYLRRPDDDSTGGDLEIYRFKNGKPYGFNQQFIDDKYVELVKTVKYERNVLVLFLNSINSLHGVTVRSVTQSPRCFVNLIGEVKQHMFDWMLYQETKSWTDKFTQRIAKVFSHS
ncbi:2OG-Fe(II) oxygenase [Aetokthonos hydrillicola Thurmond2011]|jgi:hypothetical protein|uniref:2OG-Fe(II) oxygenase n=1 Tax=Aetokthonos hydrillicola Thurmond2011 TaxID=2712845 RepID=A0AAP5I928_9CYAN|nr:2OG-Fe(II) oxygenase [Aetokthonos hydrillicola]MBO3457613.1 2OG-Fe(II) oxygenase [Aetokthonos hydrillicola CCALA 1050]MBW4587891.1 2OG-Fe(II) oxygenase [Aetokthonos hydrillicola CCALA 1050]MDR9894705.1 2OG-Fe(II) oxygenase [Aetokthonos hydrillicola Thurmond2011]